MMHSLSACAGASQRGIELPQVVIRPKAIAQIDDAVDYYHAVASPIVANRFIAELRAACDLLSQRPEIGALQYAHLHASGKLRNWKLAHFPYQLFYLAEPGNIDVIAVIHERRKIKPSIL
jgi:plasmid stabilization system protein ParE